MGVLKRRLMLMGVACALALTAWTLYRPEQPQSAPPGTPVPQPAPASTDVPRYDAKKIAGAELRMWQAYYANNAPGLLNELRDILIDQFQMSPEEAWAMALDLAAAARTFLGTAIEDEYESKVLPKLTTAYTRAQDATGEAFDPAEAARAELDWWIARRTPGHNSIEEVGQGIAKLYTVLYGETNEHIERAGLLRAEAARERDETQDWIRIRKLLEESYTELVTGVSAGE